MKATEATIVTLLLSIGSTIKPARSYQFEHGDCPSLQLPSPIRDVNRNFFHLKTWYVYAHTDPHPSYLSMFHVPPGVSPFAGCLRLHSENLRGLVLIHYNCLNFTELYQFTLYSDNPATELYQQLHSYKNLYRHYRRFGGARVLATDGDSYVVFYGCQKVRDKVLIGLLFLVRTDVYDRFIPPPALARLLWAELSLNVSHRPQSPAAPTGEQCDCTGVIRDTQKTIMESNRKERAKQAAQARIKEQFALGIRNFFVSVFSFLVWLLAMNRLIDRYVFDLKY
uniref:Lipocalin/cytosolic fatty-acid binding domain-containing protein n=1 Tax=Anopheles coluzzii TaxID=1518534 RepID=A0A8W7PD34_ANOCL